MSQFSVEYLQKCFSFSKNFNEIFDAVKYAIDNKIEDIELYHKLLSNPNLTEFEVCLFGEKLAETFPNLAFEIFMWMSSLFAATVSKKDNYEFAIRYIKKSADIFPNSIDPYLKMFECYDSFLNIPPIDEVISFLIFGYEKNSNSKKILEKIVILYEIKGDDEWSEFYRNKLK